MPEGDTIHMAARRLAPLEGTAPTVEALHPRMRRLAAALDGRLLQSVGARGKHLLLRFEGDRILHSHLRMSGAWRVWPEGARHRRGGAWLLLRGGGVEAVQFNGPVLELLDRASLAMHPVLARLGPDVLAPDFDPAQAARRARSVGGPVGEVLLQQPVASGLGNIWRSEALHARGVHPRAEAGALSEELLTEVYAWAATAMSAAVEAGRAPGLAHLRPPQLRPLRRPERSRGAGRRRPDGLVVSVLPAFA